MLKGIGIFLILFSTIMISCHPLYRRRKRMQLLWDLLQDFRYIHNELTTNLSSVPDLVDCLCTKGRTITKPSYQILQKNLTEHGAALFYEDWLCVMKSYSIYLSQEECDSLFNIGDILGKYILDEQLSEVNRLIHLYENSFSIAKSEYEEMKKVNLTIGASLGSIIVILCV